MSDTNAGRGEQTGAAQAETAPAEAAERDAFAVIEALNAENSQLKDRVLRTLAEMENLRRRTEREVSDSKTYAVTGFARDMLTVVDNLARALEHLPAEARAAADPQIQSVIEGVELTARDLEAMLGRHGVKRLDPKGQKFDPNFHQAIFEVPDETLPAGAVSQVVQSGWTIGDRVLRPAMVGVSKGGPKAAPREEKIAYIICNIRLGSPRRSDAKRGRKPLKSLEAAAKPALKDRDRRAVTRRRVRLIRPPFGRSGLAPGAIRSTPWKASRAGPPNVSASPDLSQNDRVGSLRFSPSETEEGGIAKRQREDRSGQFPFVTVLVQAHPGGVAVVEIDETGFGRRSVRSQQAPGIDQPDRHRRPKAPGLRMDRLIAVTGFVRHPAKRSAIAHPHREGLARPRHAGSIERGFDEDHAEFVAQGLLFGAVQEPGIIIDPV